MTKEKKEDSKIESNDKKIEPKTKNGSKKKNMPKKSKNVINIWKVKNNIPDYLFNAFILTLKNPNEMTITDLDKKYNDFKKKKIF